MYVKSGRARLYYELRGDPSAPPLLMLRGLARHIDHWGPVLDELVKHFRLVLMDNRGVGRSSAPLPPYTTGQMAADARAVLRAAGYQRANVFGMSLGGMIAQEFALNYPTMVHGLVLGCTRAGGGHGMPISLRSVSRLASALTRPEPEAIEHASSLVLSDAFLSEHPDVIARWQEVARERKSQRHGVLGQALAGLMHNTARRLEKIRLPTLVITGDADRLIYPENSEAIAGAIPNARLTILSGAGHDFVTEQPKESAEALRQFLIDELGERGASRSESIAPSASSS